MQGAWGVWEPSWMWSFGLFAVTITLHVVGVVLIVMVVSRFWTGYVKRRHPIPPARTMAIGLLVACALMLAVMHVTEAEIWAIVYVKLGALSNAPDAALYSLDSMTTRGASGLELAPHWRMMGAVEAADGMLLFGISTAFLFAMMQRLLRERELSRMMKS